MKRWEYCMIDFEEIDVKMLDGLGAEGWEAVGIIKRPCWDGGGTMYTQDAMLMKRPVG